MALPVTAAEIRALLALVQGVETLEVRTGRGGGVEGIEITVAIGHASRRVVRDVESALMSGLGLELDHRQITVRDNGHPKGNGHARVNPWADLLRDSTLEAAPAPGPASSGPADAAPNLRSPEPARQPDRMKLTAVRAEPDGALHCTVTVELEVLGFELRGDARDTDTPHGRQRAAARATVEALEPTLEPGTALALEGIEPFAISERPGLLAVLRGRQGNQRPAFHGAALVQGDPLEAAARAVLDACNRFLAAAADAAHPTFTERTRIKGPILTTGD